ncbi:Syntaxin-1A [Perkinsus chesapeaki]|uniref:Syntaxin-1A n=1 Tax=Perkinsus chesapeaki TaxID=330153 RepID=A0A7J6LPL0_PERCH|nr:Syntaxin-1A [Perkinsus chesapeaki]
MLPGIVDGFEDARVYITNQLQRIKVQIEEESDATEEFGQKYGTQSSTDLRARRSGCLMLLHEMKKLIGLLYGEVEEFRRDLRMHLKSQLAIALPNANDEELEEALDKGIDLRQVLKKRSSTGRVMKLQELQDQRSAVVLLEKSVVETQEMMSTLALLINHQGGLLDSIEFDVVNSKYNADKTYRSLVDTRKNQRRTQLCMLGCGCCCVLVIALIIEGLVANAVREARRAKSKAESRLEETVPERKASMRSDVSSRNDPRLKPVVDLPKQRPFHLQRAQAAKAGLGIIPVDQYELIVQYDSHMHSIEERERIRMEKKKKEDYKNALDAQMSVKHGITAKETAAREGERLAMLEAREQSRRDDEKRAALMKQKRLEMIQAAQEAERSIQRRQRREMAEKEAERKEGLERMQREAREAAVEEKRRAAANRRRIMDINQDIKDAIDAKQKAKKEEAEQAEILIKQQASEANEKAKIDALNKLKDRIKQISNTIGKAVGDENKKREEEEDRRLEAHLRAAEIASRKADADKRSRQEKAKKDMLDTLAQQVQEKAELRKLEANSNKLQGKVSREMALEALRKEAEEEEDRKRMRANMDKELEKQIRFVNLTTEEDRMDADLQRRELEFNQPLFRQMASRKFKEEKTNKLLL